jgi:hypothetical protein
LAVSYPELSGVTSSRDDSWRRSAAQSAGPGGRETVVTVGVGVGVAVGEPLPRDGPPPAG